MINLKHRTNSTIITLKLKPFFGLNWLHFNYNTHKANVLELLRSQHDVDLNEYKLRLQQLYHM